MQEYYTGSIQCLPPTTSFMMCSRPDALNSIIIFNICVVKTASRLELIAHLELPYSAYLNTLVGINCTIECIVQECTIVQ